MRHHSVKTKDVRQFDQGVDILLNTAGIERMGILHGPPGTGKTTTQAMLANKYDAINVRVAVCSTMTSVLGDLCELLGYVGKDGRRMQRSNDMYRYICQHLLEEEGTGRPLSKRPIFVDEADYCFNDPRILDVLRDIYDATQCPTILIGMEDLVRTVQKSGKFARRVTREVEFKGLDLEDTALVASELCEVEVRPDLVEYVHKETVGNIGRVKIGLTTIERFAQANGLESVSLAEWGERPLFFDQPIFGKNRNGKRK